MNRASRITGQQKPDITRERQLLGALANYHCGVYFLKTLEGFVHNLNSPLQIVWMRSEQVLQDVLTLQRTIPSDDDTGIGKLADQMKQRMDSFMGGLDKLNEILGFLSKDLLGKHRYESGDVCINEALEDALFLLKADMFFKHRVTVRLELDNSLPKIKGRHSDFCVILLALVQNALDAMVHSEDKNLTIETARQKGHIVINITDTGMGISNEDSLRVFEPFFAKNREIEYNGKTESRMGLGLPIVSRLLEDYQGTVAFESVPPKTTFVVRIPWPEQRKDGCSAVVKER
jgi:signal transduction histidine kinase